MRPRRTLMPYDPLGPRRQYIVMRQYYVLVFSLVAASAIKAQTGGASASAEVRAAAGCYTLTVSEWSRPDINAGYHRIPPRIRLDTTPSSPRGARVLSPNIAYPHQPTFRATPFWMLSGNNMTLEWSNGFQSTIVTLVRQDSLWVGEAVAESDALPMPPSPDPRAHVTARQVACP